MRVFNAEKTEEILEPNLTLGHLDKATLSHHFDYVAPVAEVGHYEAIREYPNGSRDVRWVVDVPGVEEVMEHDEVEDILIYVPYTREELVENERNDIRARRESECFPIINRGTFWYESLTEYQRAELLSWYHAWLDAPQTLVVPAKPEWLV